MGAGHGWKIGLALALAQLVGCSGAGDTSLQIRFTVNPELNSEPQLLDGIDTLRLVLDAPGGFTGVTKAEQRFGPLRATDVDGDKVLEVVFDRSMQGASSLPLLRVLPGNNLDRSFQISARGLKAGTVTAVGPPQSTRFVSGEHRDILVPLNLRAMFRAPRVALSLPQDGHSAASAPAEIYVQFSKEVTVPTDQLRLVPRQSGPATWSYSTVTVQELGFAEVRTVAKLELGTQCALGQGTTRIEATSQIHDSAANALDQDASTSTPDGYVVSFTITGATSCRCSSDAECGAGFTCDPTSGQCMPGMTSCGSSLWGCPAGYVCSSDGVCVEDCRMAGSSTMGPGTCGNGYACDQATGLCVACATPECLDYCSVVCADVCRAGVPDSQECDECLQQYGC